MDNWKPWIDSIKSRKFSALGILVLLAIPVTLVLIFRSQDTRSSAASPNNLEAEDGTLSSTGVSLKADSTASNQKFVLFGKNTGTNPTFLSRPASNPIMKDGGSSVTIENVTIQGNSVNNPTGQGIIIRNVNGPITIRDVDLANLQGGIYIYNSTGTLTIENVRSRNIGTKTSSNSDIGSGKSNHIQIAESSLSGTVSNNKFLGGRTEDMVSTWHSGGRGVGQELIFENNQFQGLVSDTSTARAWDSSSGTGIIIGDGGGSSKNGYIIVRNNTFLTPGQVGIQHIDGPGIQTYGNIIYGEKRPQNNNPMTSWEGNPRGIVRDNRYYWVNNDGSQPSPWFSAYGSLTITNNTKDSSINPAELVIDLNSQSETPTPPVDSVSIPSSIDATGNTDVTATLNNFIESVPDGKTIVFPSGSTYLLSQGIQFRGRNNLTFHGYGSKLKLKEGAGFGQLQSLFLLGKAYGGSFGDVNKNIVIRGFTFEASNPTPGLFSSSREHQHAVEADNSDGVEIYDTVARGIGGDGLKFTDGHNIYYHDNIVEDAGRQGISVISGSGLLAENNHFEDVGYYILDVEPNNNDQVATDIVFRNNTMGSWGSDEGGGFTSAGGGYEYGTIGNITISNNKFIKGNKIKLGRVASTLKTHINPRELRRMNNITFTNNVSTQAVSGPVLNFYSIDGLRVTGNSQPISSGSLINQRNNSNAILSPNP